MIKSKKLSKFKKINHFFFNKSGGTSKGIYKSLNCGLGSSDKKINVLNNLEIVRKKIGKRAKKIILTHQLHSNKFNFISKKSSLNKKIIGDALITNLVNTPVAVLTADCVPVLLFDKKNGLIGCLHAGWKGAISGIIENTVDEIKKYGKKNKIIASIGPCIGLNNYEVDLDFKKKFIFKSKKNEKFFFKKDNEKFNFDLRNFISLKLAECGVEDIDNVSKDTFSDSDNFFSFRRSLSLGEKDYGRCISSIILKKN